MTSPAYNFAVSLGGHFGRPAGHALKVLEKAVELCIAAGANAYETQRKVDNQIKQAMDKGELGLYQYDKDACAKECADVSLWLAVFVDHAGIDLDAAESAKLRILQKRRWQVDDDGVLRRP